MDKFKKEAEEIITALDKTQDNEKNLEKSFQNKINDWETAIKELEDNAEKTEEAKIARNDFDQFKKDIDNKYKELIEQKTIEQNQTNKETTENENSLLDILTKNSIKKLSDENIKKYKDRKTMRSTMEDFPWYINAIQTIIIRTWASNILKDSSVDLIWPQTKAWVLTLQKYLNKEPYKIWLEEDWIPGPNTLNALLSQVSITDSNTILNKILSEKPKFIPEKPIYPTKKNEKTNEKKVIYTKKDYSENTLSKEKKDRLKEEDINNISKKLKEKYNKLNEKDFLKITDYPFKQKEKLWNIWASFIQKQKEQKSLNKMFSWKDTKNKEIYLNEDKYFFSNINKANMAEKWTIYNINNTKKLEQEQYDTIYKDITKNIKAKSINKLNTTDKQKWKIVDNLRKWKIDITQKDGNLNIKLNKNDIFTLKSNDYITHIFGQWYYPNYFSIQKKFEEYIESEVKKENEKKQIDKTNQSVKILEKYFKEKKYTRKDLFWEESKNNNYINSFFQGFENNIISFKDFKYENQTNESISIVLDNNNENKVLISKINNCIDYKNPQNPIIKEEIVKNTILTLINKIIKSKNNDYILPKAKKQEINNQKKVEANPNSQK